MKNSGLFQLKECAHNPIFGPDIFLDRETELDKKKKD
jgi:hypothetical protein